MRASDFDSIRAYDRCTVLKVEIQCRHFRRCRIPRLVLQRHRCDNARLTGNSSYCRWLTPSNIACFYSIQKRNLNSAHKLRIRRVVEAAVRNSRDRSTLVVRSGRRSVVSREIPWATGLFLSCARQGRIPDLAYTPCLFGWWIDSRANRAKKTSPSAVRSRGGPTKSLEARKSMIFKFMHSSPSPESCISGVWRAFPRSTFSSHS